MKKNAFPLYVLDKKICQMIIDIESLSKSMHEEYSNLRSHSLFAKDEDKKEVQRIKEDYKELTDKARLLIGELFRFKHALTEYQFKRQESQLNETNKYFGKSKEEIKKIEEAYREKQSLEDKTNNQETQNQKNYELPEGISIEEANKMYAEVARYEGD